MRQECWRSTAGDGLVIEPGMTQLNRDRHADGPHKGRYVIDVLNELCRRHEDDLDPRRWSEDWEGLGFLVVDECLKRFNGIDGYYHA